MIFVWDIKEADWNEYSGVVNKSIQYDGCTNNRI